MQTSSGNTYNIFTDFHHAGLLQSFILLFEKRFGGKVYRPIGTEWFDKGYWKVYDHPATVEQFLGIGGATPDGTPPLNEVLTTSVLPDGTRTVYHCHDIDSGETNKAITFDGFMNTHIDYVIASLPYHIEPFRRLCDSHPSHPKLIYQIGNAWNIDEETEKLVDGIMASAKTNHPVDKPYIEYHQEFDLDVFKEYDGGRSHFDDLRITSFINCFNTAGHFAEDWQLFQRIEKQMPQYKFRSYGGQCRDGSMNGNQQVANAMHDSQFVWHTKNGGDGYGHIIYNTAAIGVPMIVKKQYYTGKMGEELMIDGETCITIDGLNDQEIITKISYYNDDNRYMNMRVNAYNNFYKKVDFQKEAEALQMYFAEIGP